MYVIYLNIHTYSHIYSLNIVIVIINIIIKIKWVKYFQLYVGNMLLVFAAQLVFNGC